VDLPFSTRMYVCMYVCMCLLMFFSLSCSCMKTLAKDVRNTEQEIRQLENEIRSLQQKQITKK
jgi:cell division protein FtsB